MRWVLDTNVLVAAFRCATGASRALLKEAFARRFTMLASPTVFMEYEAVLKRKEHLKAAGARLSDVDVLLNALAIVVEPVEVSYLWRPQLKDPADEMMLEAAVNGQAHSVITFNIKHFYEATMRFGITTKTPKEALRTLRRKYEKK